jgi:hypothetical protein
MPLKKLTGTAIIGVISALTHLQGQFRCCGRCATNRQRRFSRLRFHLWQMANAQPPSEESPGRISRMGRFHHMR